MTATFERPGQNVDALVAKAVGHWRDELFDLGGRNTLLFYKDLKVGTLEIGDAEPGALARLFDGERVQLGDLFPEDAAFGAALKRARAIYKKIREYDEERGVQVGYVAVGMATWEDETRSPAAPVLLRPVQFQPVTSQATGFALVLGEETEVNPALLHLLETGFGVEIPPETFGEPNVSDPEDVYASLKASAAEVPGFAIGHRTVIGTFSYAKLPMVRDLQNADALLADSTIVAALAGDPESLKAVRVQNLGRPVPAVDAVPPHDEYLVLDADSSQSYAINAVVAGRHLVVDGPPGTGKSQTIANLLATLMGRGLKVLFVAEKRAAIDAVLRRLEGVGLGDLVLDVHDGVTNRRKIAAELGAALDQAARTLRVDDAAVHRRLTEERDRLNRHVAVMHAPREPWTVSAFEAQAALLGLQDAEVRTRLAPAHLDDLAGDVFDRTRVALREFVELGGLAPDGRTPWKDADLRTGEQARRAMRVADGLHDTLLPEAKAAMRKLATSAGLREPTDPAAWEETLRLLESVRETLSVLRDEVYQADLSDLIAATAERSWRREHEIRMSFGQRRRLRKKGATLALAKTPMRELHHALSAAKEQLAQWQQLSADDGAPRVPDELVQAAETYTRMTSDLSELATVVRSVELLRLPLRELTETLAALAADRVTPLRTPKLVELREELSRVGLSPLIAEFDGTDPVAEAAVAAFEYAWYASILDGLSVADADYAALEGGVLDGVVNDFRDHDREHLALNARRIRRAVAENLYTVLDGHPEQAALVRKQAALRRNLLPVRRIVQSAPETLLALKPVWAMSPLVVSQTLPARRLFDVVIFDEASQVPTADAVPAIMRAGRVVVAGDPRQLPPTSFFASANDDGEPDEADDLSFATGFESVLDALRPVLPVRSLTWHYRSRNERLIAFSNHWVYDGSLTTFPGANEDGAIRHVVVEPVPRPGEERSIGEEVREVVRLVLEHAERTPDASLGVITMGIEHARRVEAALDRARADRPDLEAFFADRPEEAFFVKNLERVQGDERDAIILSLGYGKGPEGRLRHHFGPLNQSGGERRLNVAVTRAKHRMTLVSSFTSADLDPNRLNAEGARLLRAYLEFAESGGTRLGAALADRPALNPFEIDVRDRLTAAGLPLTAQYGAAGYKIDFVAAHPDRPGEMVLAIEADGAGYHSSDSARDRDRLRQQQLESLGWTFHRIWSTDWFRDPDREVRKARAAYDRAVAAADRRDVVVPRPAPDPDPLPADEPLPVRRKRRPPIGRGLPITQYSQRELVRLVAWIESDGLLRTEDDLVGEVMNELGFRRRGVRILATVRQAIATHRQR